MKYNLRWANIKIKGRMLEYTIQYVKRSLMNDNKTIIKLCTTLTDTVDIVLFLSNNALLFLNPLYMFLHF